MKQYTIYTVANKDTNVIEIVTKKISSFPISRLSKTIGFSYYSDSKKREKHCSSSQSAHLYVTVHHDKDNKESFFDNLNDIFEFFSKAQTGNEEIIHTLLTHLTMINLVIKITASDTVQSSFYELCGQLTESFCGIAMLDNKILLDENCNIIIYPDGSAGNSILEPIAKLEHQNRIHLHSRESYRRAAGSIRKLMKRNIPVRIHFPEFLSSEYAKLRSREEIARRAIALLLFIQYACDVAYGRDLTRSKQVLPHLLKKYDVLNKLTRQELNFIQEEKPDETDAINYSWQYEAYWVLIWTLGLIKSLPFPEQVCDTNDAINIVLKCKNFHRFLKQTKLRNIHEILDEADLTYRLGWACVNARTGTQPIPAALNPSVIAQRHKAFHWLLNTGNNSSWDHLNSDNYEKTMLAKTIVIGR